jgi:L-rhamnose mutarotase
VLGESSDYFAIFYSIFLEKGANRLFALTFPNRFIEVSDFSNRFPKILGELFDYELFDYFACFYLIFLEECENRLFVLTFPKRLNELSNAYFFLSPKT